MAGEGLSLMQGTKILSGTEAYYAGSSKYIRYGLSGEVSFSKEVGYVMSNSETNSCVSHTNPSFGPTSLTSVTDWANAGSISLSNPGLSVEASSKWMSGSSISLGFTPDPSFSCSADP